MKEETATLAGGCFWCLEAIFKRLKGVKQVTSGYAGGKTPDPTYDQIHTGQTGYAESIQIKFDPKVLSFETLLDVFWKLHDPTTLNRQGADIGTEYRSVIFYHDENQRQIAKASKKQLEKSGLFENPIVTEITPFTNFYPAQEDFNQNFYDKNPNQPYCRIVIDPKLTKLYKEFKDQVT